ncbi:DUF982 domain-containing protein [Pseudaminobacter salicylatoxidans]|uniref:DUF982 domain-containing protein n=1 Tax=Pseudaminobacter salicylatoxidans TaxID=93369 RepID=UPI00037643B6
MDSLQFFMPVRIAPDATEPVVEIYSIDQALDFLLAWPTGRQGPIYQKALNACFEASLDETSTEDARRAFLGFVRVCGILAKDTSVPVAALADAWLASPEESGKPRRKSDRGTRSSRDGPSARQ